MDLLRPLTAVSLGCAALSAALLIWYLLRRPPLVQRLARLRCHVELRHQPKVPVRVVRHDVPSGVALEILGPRLRPIPHVVGNTNPRRGDEQHRGKQKVQPTVVPQAASFRQEIALFGAAVHLQPIVILRVREFAWHGLPAHGSEMQTRAGRPCHIKAHEL